MTEKRFTLAYEKGNWWAVRDWDITLWKEEVIHLLNEFDNKTQQLQERNDRQADTIRELYTLIENKDWEGLTAIIEDLKQCEEQLQREYRCYE